MDSSNNWIPTSNKKDTTSELLGKLCFFPLYHFEWERLKICPLVSLHATSNFSVIALRTSTWAFGGWLCVLVFQLAFSSETVHQPRWRRNPKGRLWRKRRGSRRRRRICQVVEGHLGRLLMNHCIDHVAPTLGSERPWWDLFLCWEDAEQSGC